MEMSGVNKSVDESWLDSDKRKLEEFMTKEMEMKDTALDCLQD